MHRFFELLITNPQTVNRILCDKNNNNVLFTDVFRELFFDPASTSGNIQSYLWALSTFFDFNEYEIRIHPNTRNQVNALFQEFGIDPGTEINCHVYRLLLYLHKMFWLIVTRKGYNPQQRNDNIFGFFRDGNKELRNVKVVIVANEPSPNCPSSGRAFHLSQCSSTSNILQFLNQEMQFVQSIFRGGEPLVLSQQELDSCDLQGWLNQGVLLLNSRLTRKTPQWDAFTDNLVDYVSKYGRNVVFVLMGKVAGQKARFINQYNHLVMNVHHPSYYLHETARRGDAWDWSIVMPFLNTNFSLFQTDPASLIDWSNLTGNKPQGANRMRVLYDFFTFIGTQSVLLGQHNRYTTIYLAGNPLCTVQMNPNGRLFLRRNY